MGWKQRMTALGIGKHLQSDDTQSPHLTDALKKLSIDYDDKNSASKRDMNILCEQALEMADADAAANLGSQIHRATEDADSGEITALTEQWAQHVAAYRAATTQLRVTHIEQFLVNDSIRVAGTADRIFSVDGVDGLVIGDIKTGSIDYPGKFALQLGIYAHSLMYDPQTETRTPIPNIRQDKGIIIHLDVKTAKCSLHWINIAAGWEAVQLAIQVREWRTCKDLLSPLTLDPSWEYKIFTTTTLSDLLAVKASAEAASVWTSDLADIARNQWAQLQQKQN
jgi:hypothetical protein